jgi:hypothetical protein
VLSLLSLFFPRVHPTPPPWPPPRPAASRLPASRRACPGLRRASLFLPARGIELPHLETSPVPPTSPAAYRSSAARFAAAPPFPATPPPSDFPR